MEGKMDLQTDEQTTIDMWTDKEGEKQTDGWKNTQTDGLIDRWRDKEINIQEKTDKERYENRQIYGRPDGHADRWTDNSRHNNG